MVLLRILDQMVSKAWGFIGDFIYVGEAHQYRSLIYNVAQSSSEGSRTKIIGALLKLLYKNETHTFSKARIIYFQAKCPEIVVEVISDKELYVGTIAGRLTLLNDYKFHYNSKNDILVEIFKYIDARFALMEKASKYQTVLMCYYLLVLINNQH